MIIPMAGEGQRFRQAGISTPKPLIPVGGVPMFQLVLSNLWDKQIGEITLIIREEFGGEEIRNSVSQALGISVNTVSVSKTTKGPAESVMFASEFISNDQAVVVANSDQWVNFRVSDFYEQLLNEPITGNILTMEDDDPKWSYVALNSHGEVEKVVEKEVISPRATVGIYGFESGQSMTAAFGEMMKNGDTVNGEFYVGPAYNYLSRRNGPVLTTNLGPLGTSMWGLGTPEDLQQFVESALMESATEKARELFT